MGSARNLMHCLTAVTMASALLLVSGCGDDDGGGPPSLELGTGQFAFMPIADGDTVPLVFGCQGGQHVWVALRIRNLQPRSAIVELVLERLSDAREISLPFTVRLTFDPSGDGSSYDTWGLTLQTPTVEDAVDQDVVVHARVTDLANQVATADKPLHVVLGESVCRGADGGLVLMRDAGTPDAAMEDATDAALESD